MHVLAAFLFFYATRTER